MLLDPAMQRSVRLPARVERVLSSLCAKLGVGVTSYAKLRWLIEHHQAYYTMSLLKEYPPEIAATALAILDRARSQIGQDIFALLESGFRRGGFFVEFGAADGVEGSNTWLLEKEFNWTGILAEPAKGWHDALRGNRSCTIDQRCVWSGSGATLRFNEVENTQLSTVSTTSRADHHSEARNRKITYGVESVSLLDLLESHRAPSRIDYLSVDTEGSEYEILSAFDFSRYEFGVITCEHAYAADRERLRDLLNAKGYVQRFPELSQFDHWFVNA